MHLYFYINDVFLKIDRLFLEVCAQYAIKEKWFKFYNVDVILANLFTINPNNSWCSCWIQSCDCMKVNCRWISFTESFNFGIKPWENTPPFSTIHANFIIIQLVENCSSHISLSGLAFRWILCTSDKSFSAQVIPKYIRQRRIAW